MTRVRSEAAAHIGRKIREYRTALGYTQDLLGVTSNIDSSNIRAYESGRSMPNVQSLVRIAYALEVHPGKLLDELTLEMFISAEEQAAARQAPPPFRSFR